MIFLVYWFLIYLGWTILGPVTHHFGWLLKGLLKIFQRLWCYIPQLLIGHHPHVAADQSFKHILSTFKGWYLWGYNQDLEGAPMWIYWGTEQVASGNCIMDPLDDTRTRPEKDIFWIDYQGRGLVSIQFQVEFKALFFGSCRVFGWWSCCNECLFCFKAALGWLTWKRCHIFFA